MKLRVKKKRVSCAEREKVKYFFLRIFSERKNRYLLGTQLELLGIGELGNRPAKFVVFNVGRRFKAVSQVGVI
jgi:hypothetical protein